MTTIPEEEYLAHYGILRRSGRYPWGSGGPENASNKAFLDYVAKMQKEGISEAQIAEYMGINTRQLRAAKSIARNEERQANINMATRLKDKGMSNVAIAERMGLPESSVRALLAPGIKDKADILTSTSNMLRDQVTNKKYIDIGTGVENQLGISQTKLATAVAVLQEEGYKIHYLKVTQLGTGKQTTIKVLSAPDVPYTEVSKNRDQIKQIQTFSEDGGRSYLGVQTPLSVSSKRVDIRYEEQGGADSDGVIFVRPGVDDVSLGGARYAQVRIAVDGTHYLKGMAMYRDDLPDGVDLVFNTNKKDSGNKLDAMKAMKDDPDNPFGAVVRQKIDAKTGKVKSAMNIVNEEGDWDRWSKNLSSQMLSKQSPNLAKQQLEMTYERKQREFDDIMELTNPAVRKKLLESFSDGVDSAAVHLKAAALPRQRSNVILPINSLSEKEIYAPNFRHGEKVALVRYPHGGIFEIPELTVNNRHPKAKRALGQALDAVGINSKVAERLSGADFDGDTVLVIPNNKRSIKTSPALEGLKGFDPQRSYPSYEGMKVMTPRTKAIEMGQVSNLITDMTIRGATTQELARAVRHSMVVIDAEKHKLNYKQSAVDNGVAQLKAKYQGGSRAGASTLISRATSEIRVEERKPRPAAEGGAIDKATGKKVYVPTGETYTNRKGNVVKKTFESRKLAETTNAHTLSSGTPIEKVYADHSNRLKKLANQARKALVNTRTTAYSPTAKKVYENEVSTLRSKLNIAQRNRPLERHAQLLANAIVQAKRDANPNMEASDLKKIQGQALAEARARTGAGKQRIEITPKEWAAIQAGAISNNTLTQILSNADLDRVKELATPRTKVLMTSAKTARAQSMLAAGYTQSEIADALGVSLTTLKTTIAGG
jgi:DNA-binding CsgD family transcriptional regulator